MGNGIVKRGGRGPLLPPPSLLSATLSTTTPGASSLFPALWILSDNDKAGASLGIGRPHLPYAAGKDGWELVSSQRVKHSL